MTGAVYAQGHWRRRDPLEGLNEALLAALEDAFAEPLAQVGGRGPWRAGLRARGHARQTVAAAARRGLLRLRCDAAGQTPRYALTAAGLACVQEIRRRAKARKTLARDSGRGTDHEAVRARARAADVPGDPQ